MTSYEKWEKILDETFHMARKTMDMAVPSPKTKHAVTQGSPHPKLVSRHASKENVPLNCFTPESARAQEAVEAAARARTLKGTAGEIEAYGFRGRNLQEHQQEQEFTDTHISPYRLPPPEIVHGQPPPELKTMRKPTVGVIDYKKKPKVWLKRKTLKVSFPSDVPVGASQIVPEVGQLLGKESPDRKPWDWPCEEAYPGSKKPEKLLKNLKYRVEKIKRKWVEAKRDAVRSREPRVGQEKRFGDLDFQHVFPPHSYTVYRKKQEEEEFALRGARREWAEKHKRQLFTSETSPPPACESPEGYGEEGYGTPQSSMRTCTEYGSPSSQASWMPQSAGSPLLNEAAEFVDYAQNTLGNLDPSQFQGEPSTWL